MLTNCIQTNKSILKQKEKKASDIFYLRYCFTFSRMWYNWYHAVYNLFQTERFVFNPWLGKIPWRRERLATPLFWPGEFHGLYSLWSHKESDTTERLSLSQCITFPRLASVQFSRSVVSDSLRPHELQHARPPCPSPNPGVHTDSRPSSQ